MTSENVQAAQLIAEGPQDIWLTGDPQASFFRSMYRRHVSYGMSVEKFNLNGDTIRFDRRGDLLGACYLTASDPITNVQLSTFPITGLARVDLFIGGQLVDSQDTTFSSQVWPVTEATTWSERNVPSSFYPLHFFFCKDWSRAFPLVALEYHDLEIKIRDASSSYTFTLWAHMIHLSDPERAWYKRQPHRFLITQTQTARIDLQRDWGRFGGPIKYLAWPAKIVPPPGIVTGFTASNPTSTTVDLAWDPALYASSYSIVSLPPTTTQTTSDTTLTFPGLDPDTEYTFYITASNASGQSASEPSNPVTTLSPPPLPVALPYLFAYGATASTVDLSWRPNPNTDLYSIESSPPSTTPNQTTNDSQMTFTGLDPNTEYTFTITPSNATGNGPSTTSNPITTLPLPVNATGGTITTYSSGGTTYRVHTFTSDGTFEVTYGGAVDVLVVGGGGGGSIADTQGMQGGGGGGGQVVYQTNVLITLGSYTATIGSGGYRIRNDSSNPVAAQTSSIFSINALPGQNAPSVSGTLANGGTSGSGQAGGVGSGSIFSSSGGGGGDSQPGNNNGNGGNGSIVSISGTSVYYGGGGGGGWNQLYNPTEGWAPGGLGGGGNGGGYPYYGSGTPATDGSPNTGGGGGGGFSSSSIPYPNTEGARGGSGIIIVRYTI